MSDNENNIETDKVISDSNVTSNVTSNVLTSEVDLVNKDNVIKLTDNSDLFITEKDTFDITVRYYKKDEVFVENVDDVFDSNEPSIKQFSITFKYPNQGDFETIMAQNAYKSPDQLKLIDILQMELTRIVVLIRKWTLNAEFARLAELDPKVIKGIAQKVREKLGMRGIL